MNVFYWILMFRRKTSKVGYCVSFSKGNAAHLLVCLWLLFSKKWSTCSKWTEVRNNNQTAATQTPAGIVLAVCQSDICTCLDCSPFSLMLWFNMYTNWPIKPIVRFDFYDTFATLILFHFCSSGIELMNSAALLLLFLLNLLLVGRQERLKRTEMVRRLKDIITQLSGESGSLTDHWKYREMIVLPEQNNFC